MRTSLMSTSFPTAVRYFLFVLCACFPIISQAQIVLAFTDTLGKSTSLDGTARSKMLIKNMARADVKQAMFLISSKNINADTVGRLDYYDQTGQLLVNAGHHISRVHRQKNYGYPIDIMKANGALESYSNYHKHVSVPYLYGYSDSQLLQQLHDFLYTHNYLPTYITTRVHDNYMNHLYQQRMQSGRNLNMRALENAYIKMVLDAVNRYDAKAHMMLGFSPRQVLLLHETDLTAYFITALIDELNKQGYTVIPPEHVFTDPVSNPFFKSGFSEPNYMSYITGLPDMEQNDIWVDVANQKDKEEIQHYLNEQGLGDLVGQ